MIDLIFNGLFLAYWSEWGNWSACNESCGSGSRQRIRSCVGGNDCSGPNDQSEECNTAPCGM